MPITLGSLSRRAIAAVVTLTLVAGLCPSAWAATSNTGNANSSASDTTSASASDTSSSSEDSDSGASDSSASNTSDSSSDSSEDADDDEEDEDDPYASMYETSAAEAGSSVGSIEYVVGDTAGEAAAAQMLAAFDSADTVVLVPVEAKAESLSAVALAGALGCPVMLIERGGLDAAELDAVEALGVSRAIIVADSSCDVSAAEEALGAIAYEVAVEPEDGEDSEDDEDSTELIPVEVERIQGYDATDTSLEVVRWGRSEGLWNLATMVLANGSDAQTANAVAGYAYRMAQPVILTGKDGKLTAPQRLYFTRSKEALAEPVANLTVLAVDEGVSQSAVDCLSLVGKETMIRTKTTVVSGGNSVDVNYNAERRYAETHDVSWDGSIIANPDQSSCATAGVLAAALGVGHFATEYEEASASTMLPAEDESQSFCLSGEGAVVETWTLNSICAGLGMYEVSTVSAGISIDDAANNEVDNSMTTEGVAEKSKDEILEAMDPGVASRGTVAYYEFAQLGDGYSGVVTAAQIDGFIDSIVGPYESSYGATSMMRGTGQAFIDAAKENDINEVYLLAHAILESACGCSQLARGTVSGYYNFFGISAYDSNPNAGASYAAAQGWNSAEAAVKGGGKWISENYIHSSYGQDTLYLMRFNVPSQSHQYASSLTWTTSIAKLMDRFYSYAGISLSHTGLNFKVVEY